MVRLFEVLCLAAMVSLGGCTAKPQEPQLKGVKIGELAPKGPLHAGIQPRILRTTNINCLIFELPAENVEFLDGIWRILNSDSVRYNDPDGFAANGLRAAAGEYGALEKVNELLKSAEAQRMFTTALLIPDGQAEVIGIGRLTRKTTISYIYRQGAIKIAEVGPAICGLQLTAGKLPGPSTLSTTLKTGSLSPQDALRRTGTQPVASVQVVPVILASTEGLPPELAEQLKANDLRFYSAGFSAMMKPGDIVLLAPREYTADEVTAAGRFFTRLGEGPDKTQQLPGTLSRSRTRTGPKPAVRVFLFICTSIT